MALLFLSPIPMFPFTFLYTESLAETMIVPTSANTAKVSTTPSIAILNWNVPTSISFLVSLLYTPSHVKLVFHAAFRFHLITTKAGKAVRSGTDPYAKCICLTL